MKVGAVLTKSLTASMPPSTSCIALDSMMTHCSHGSQRKKRQHRRRCIRVGQNSDAGDRKKRRRGADEKKKKTQGGGENEELFGDISSAATPTSGTEQGHGGRSVWQTKTALFVLPRAARQVFKPCGLTWNRPGEQQHDLLVVLPQEPYT